MKEETMRTKFNISAGILLAVVSLSSLYPAHAAEIACVSGHQTVVPPCTFDNGVLSLDGTTPDFTGGGGGGGHHTLAEFVGPTLTIEADIFSVPPHPPYMATDGTTTGISELLATITISTVSGTPLIGDLSLQILSPVFIGTGAMSFSGTGSATLSPLTGLPGSTFEDVGFAPRSSLTETFDFILSTGCGAPSATCTGNAIVNGVTIGVSTIPEPSSFTLFGLALVVFALIRYR